MDTVPLDTFPALAAIPAIRHGFTTRIPGLDVKADRATALARLDQFHAQARAQIGAGAHTFITADQVHGREVAIVDAHSPAPVSAVDGLITADPRVCLGIHVADCGPIFLADPVRRVIALLHSGKNGTALGIATAAIAKMISEFGSDPAHIIAQLGPCIRPPHYEIDFAADILAQCRAAGLVHVHDCATCTASQPARYYSYRREQGQTGRLLALLALA